jgi:pimeloyl-ACP methyl ester carboxylesterase
MNLAPALATQGHQVFQLHYPNDQPIHDSAIYMSDSMRQLGAQGIGRITVVAHSMGGLVSREMLTHPEVGYSSLVSENKAPKVRGLIMVGTPNQGVHIARLRVLAEFREQIARGLAGKGHWLGWLVDGGGEAKIDLLPESSFLTALNGRAHPPDVALLTIAGIATPVEKESLFEPLAKEASNAPSQSRWSRTVARVAKGVGDGLVPVDAVRLNGVEFLTVSGTHLSMVRNISAESQRIPPAVPIILKRVKLWERNGS